MRMLQVLEYQFEWLVKGQRYNFILCINAMGLLIYRQIY